MHYDYNAGDIVYIFYRNPHIQDVANIQEAAVVNNPENPEELALFHHGKAMKTYQEA